MDTKLYNNLIWKHYSCQIEEKKTKIKIKKVNCQRYLLIIHNLMLFQKRETYKICDYKQKMKTRKKNLGLRLALKNKTHKILCIKFIGTNLHYIYYRA